jgi:hypothetical protein
MGTVICRETAEWVTHQTSVRDASVSSTGDPNQLVARKLASSTIHSGGSLHHQYGNVNSPNDG